MSSPFPYEILYCFYKIIVTIYRRYRCSYKIFFTVLFIILSLTQKRKNINHLFLSAYLLQPRSQRNRSVKSKPFAPNSLLIPEGVSSKGPLPEPTCGCRITLPRGETQTVAPLSAAPGEAAGRSGATDPPRKRSVLGRASRVTARARRR